MNSDWQRRLIEMMEDNDVVWQRLYLIRKMAENRECENLLTGSYSCASCRVGGGRTTLTLLAFQADYNCKIGVTCWDAAQHILDLYARAKADEAVEKMLEED